MAEFSAGLHTHKSFFYDKCARHSRSYRENRWGGGGGALIQDSEPGLDIAMLQLEEGNTILDCLAENATTTFRVHIMGELGL